MDDKSVWVRPLWTRCIALELQAAGLDIEQALAESGLNWQSLNAGDGWVPFVAHARLFEIAALKLEDDLYGMKLAQRVDVHDGDILAYLGVASETIEAALRNMARYSRVFSEAFEVALEIDDDG